MKQENIKKTVGVLSIVASLLGIYYLANKIKTPVNTAVTLNPNIDYNAPTQTNPTQQSEPTSVIGRTIVAKQNNTIVYKAKEQPGYWEATDEIRLTRKQDEEIGVVIAIVDDGFTEDRYAVVDIPFYIGSPFANGHGFINLNQVKTI